MSEAIKIRKMEPADVDAVARLHCESLPADFLPSLGQRFLARTYYPQMLANPFAEVIVSEVEGRLVGFVNVAADPDRYLGRVIRQRPLAVLFCAVRLLFRDPRRLMEAVLISVARKPQLSSTGEIAFIAVDRESRGLGLGKQLVDAAERYFSSNQLTHGYTKTLASNDHVIAMYRQRGARVSHEVSIGNKSYVGLQWACVGRC